MKSNDIRKSDDVDAIDTIASIFPICDRHGFAFICDGVSGMRCLLATVCACESQVQGSHKPPRAVQGPSYSRDVRRFQFRSLDNLSFRWDIRDSRRIITFLDDYQYPFHGC